MLDLFVVIAMLLFAIMSIRARRLIASALWLAGVSTLLSIFFYRLGAWQVAVIELSVGAGLVTVLFVFAISVAGEDFHRYDSVIPAWLAGGIVVLGLLFLAWFVIQPPSAHPVGHENPLSFVLFQQRGIDMIVQVALIFAGTLGLLSLLAEAKAPLQFPVAEQAAAQRDKELNALAEQSLVEELT